MNITLKLRVIFSKILWANRAKWNKEIHLPGRTLFKLISEIFKRFNFMCNIKTKVTLRKKHLKALKYSSHSEKIYMFYLQYRHVISLYSLYIHVYFCGWESMHVVDTLYTYIKWIKTTLLKYWIVKTSILVILNVI